jgi:prophage maintenance system killer protein
MSKKQEEKTWYPNAELVLKIHEIMLQKYGGWPGFERGMNVFQSILAEMKVAKGIYRKAAILLRGIVTGRIFKDGNHRTAQALTETFLEVNNASMYIQGSKEIIRFIKSILHYKLGLLKAFYTIILTKLKRG